MQLFIAEAILAARYTLSTHNLKRSQYEVAICHRKDQRGQVNNEFAENCKNWRSENQGEANDEERKHKEVQAGGKEQRNKEQ